MKWWLREGICQDLTILRPVEPTNGMPSAIGTAGYGNQPKRDGQLHEPSRSVSISAMKPISADTENASATNATPTIHGWVLSASRVMARTTTVVATHVT
jgi:hypothetical protein